MMKLKKFRHINKIIKQALHEKEEDFVSANAGTITKLTRQTMSRYTGAAKGETQTGAETNAMQTGKTEAKK